MPWGGNAPGYEGHMIWSVPFFLYLIALILTVFSAVTPPRVPTWIPLLIVCVGLLVQVAGK